MKVYIITSAKFEECYIEEWVKHHLIMGFDKIIINDNNPKDYPYKLQDILKQYIDNGQVIVERYYDHFMQSKFQEIEITKIYWWLYKKYENEFDWFAKLDIDEYLEIPETNNDIKKFLLQDKFNNALSIIVPWALYAVTEKYAQTYVRLKNDKDRYYKHNITYCVWHFKSIIKKDKYLAGIQLHFAEYFNHIQTNNIKYVLPDGINAKTKINFDYSINEEKINNKLLDNKSYIDDIANNICRINHYNTKSIEEQIIHAKKFEADKYEQWCCHNNYIKLYNEYKDMFDNPRDLYKIYFLNNNE